MRLGLIGYTNLNSGIGIFIWEFFHYLDGDSILSVHSTKGIQQVWTDRQITVGRPPNNAVVEKYLDVFKPDVIMFIETPFNENVLPLASARGVKIVGIPMHETGSLSRMGAHLYICPCPSAWDKTWNITERKLMFLPIGLELFPFKERTGHTFVFNIGYGGPYDRRQGEVVIAAFRALEDPNARMIVNSQVNFPGRQNDPRIEYRLQNFPEPKGGYDDGDIAILPMAYGGYERPILEAMACGLPCLTTDADPMNLFQHDPDFLIKPCSSILLSRDWVYETYYNAVSVEDLKAKMEWLLIIDTAKYSHRARRQAEAQSWESKEIDYKSLWMKTLEDMCF